VTRLRDDANEFEGAIAAAAGELGLAPLFVEKDYWVTQVLACAQRPASGLVRLQGRHELSKGYGLIERFSEDVDILVSPAKDDSARTREELLLTMTASVADELGVQWPEGRAPGRGRLAHRADVFVYRDRARSCRPDGRPRRAAGNRLRRRRVARAKWFRSRRCCANPCS